MTDQRTEYQIAEFKDIFSLFEREDGTILATDLKIVLRSLGHNPTEEELMKDLNINDANLFSIASVDFQEFTNKVIPNRIKQTEKMQEGINDSFKVFDKDGHGLVSAEELKRVLTTLGEKIDGNIIDKLIEEAGPDDHGYINLSELIKMMILK